MNHHSGIRAALLAACLPLLAACDAVFDYGEEDCTVTYRVQFRYDMNMKRADAFAAEVNRVTLYASGEDGRVVWQHTEEGAPLAADGYAMTLPLPAGDYRLTAWCGASVDGGAHFSIGEDLSCSLNHGHDADGTASVTTDLDRLYHGMLSVSLPATMGAERTFTCTVPLVKNTNVVRVVLQQLAGQSLDPSRFSFFITADNGRMDAGNVLLADEPVTYHAWRVESAQGEVYAGTGEAGRVSVSYPAVVAELTTARLVKGRDVRLTVTDRDTGGTVLSIPLIDYALMVKGYYNEPMDDQEYLDRQDEYSMVFFLDEGSRWMNAYIYVNSWKIVLQGADI